MVLHDSFSPLHRMRKDLVVVVIFFFFQVTINFIIENFDFPNIDIFACAMLLAAPSEIRKSEYKEDGIPVDNKLPVKHVITKELQVYTFCGMYFFFKFHFL